MDKPTLPKGTRDFGPAQMAKRQFIFNTIRMVFQKYGFQPLETPAMENLSTLTGKYGDEGDQLLFKVLDSGNYIDEENLISLIMKSKFKIYTQDLYDGVNNFLGGVWENVNNSQIKDAIINSFDSISTKNEDVPLLNEYKWRLRDNLDEIAANINIWLTESSNSSKKIKTDSANYLVEMLIDFLQKRNQNVNQVIDLFLKPKYLTPHVASKGLRYDLTVPFARYVVMNRHEITFPFKRYQIQPVWRADRPQKGRYREFYQCDADVVGTDSLICEAEIILMIKEVFKGLGITDYTIKLNHRAILSGLAEICKGGNETSLFVAIDKLDKIGEEKVKEELRSRGFADANLTEVFEILNFKGTTSEKIQYISQKFANSEAGKKGISDLTQVLQLLKDYNATEDHVEFDIALARGLSYYTGCIFEVKINNVAIGSVSGGGRYDNLTGGFGLPNVSGVGFSFGVDRLYDSMEELKLFPQEAQISSKVLIAHFDAESKKYGLGVLQQLRAQGIASEIYPDAVKIQKQLEYANKKLIPYVIVIGSEEVKSGLLAFKNMKTGEQQKMSVGEIINLIK